jgi:hypothetical protein
MSKSAIAPQEVTGGDNLHSPTPEEIRDQLRNILESPPFHGSKRCHQFLEYVCDQALAGQVGALKERTIAIAVFGRQPQSDLGEDTIVRVGAREVRKRLAQYYVTAEGAAAKVRIDLPSGAYAPEFHYVIPWREEGAPAAIVVPRPVQRPKRRNRRRLLAIGASAALLLAVAVAVKLVGANPNVAPFQRFWAPVFQSREPLLIAVAHPIVYHPSRRILQWSEAHQPPDSGGVQTAAQLPPNVVSSDLVPVFNQYVGFGDMVAANEVTQMLARKSKDVRVRMASGIEFADLRKAPTFLIGAVTNRWTMELQQTWRFRFTHRDVDLVITDSQQPGQEWSIPAKDDGSSPEDYFLICRIRNSLTGGFTIAAAGLKQFGTEAAGRLLADGDQLGAILRKLPAGWESRNLQFILHARVISNTPAQPELVAFHVW